MALAAIGFASCASDSNSVTLILEPQLGELGNYFSIPSDEVTIQLIEESKDSIAEIAITSSLEIKVEKTVASTEGFDLDVTVYDKDHVKIADLPDFDIDSDYDYHREFRNILSAGTVYAQMERTTDASKWDAKDQEMWDKIRKEGKYLSIKPEYAGAKYAINGQATDSSQDDDTSVAELSEVEITEALDAYEEYVDKYVACMQSIKNGDTNANTELPTLLAEANKLANKLAKVKGSLSEEQTERMAAILSKMSSVK